MNKNNFFLFLTYYFNISPELINIIFISNYIHTQYIYMTAAVACEIIILGKFVKQLTYQHYQLFI